MSLTPELLVRRRLPPAEYCMAAGPSPSTGLLAAREPLYLRPHPEQIVIAAGQRHDRRVCLAELARKTLDRDVHLEQHSALRFVADHALDPEERRDALARGDRRHVVQARSGIQNEIAGVELHGMRAVRVLDGELAALVAAGIAEKQRRGKIAAQPFDAAALQPHGIVDVHTELLA